MMVFALFFRKNERGENEGSEEALRGRERERAEGNAAPKPLWGP